MLHIDLYFTLNTIKFSSIKVMSTVTLESFMTQLWKLSKLILPENHLFLGLHLFDATAKGNGKHSFVVLL